MSIVSFAHIEVPPGVMWDFAGTTAPATWLLCDGTAYSRTTYANLYSALGGSSSPWGQGDGSTTFNVPDLRGRVLVGVGTGSGLSARSLGATGGEENHALSGAEMTSHSHSHNHTATTATESANHSHANQAVTGTTGSTGLLASTTASNNGAIASTAGVSASHTHALTTTTDATGAGSGAGHNTMQPFAVVTKIIKT